MSFDQKSDAEILAIADPIMDNLMEASTNIDHDRHTSDFTDRLKSIATKEHLTKVCKKYQEEKGFFAEREFVSVIRRPGAVGIIWKQRFTQAEGDFIAEMLLVNQEGVYLVDHVMIW